MFSFENETVTWTTCALRSATQNHSVRFQNGENQTRQDENVDNRIVLSLLNVIFINLHGTKSTLTARKSLKFINIHWNPHRQSQCKRVLERDIQRVKDPALRQTTHLGRVRQIVDGLFTQSALYTQSMYPLLGSYIKIYKEIRKMYRIRKGWQPAAM